MAGGKNEVSEPFKAVFSLVVFLQNIKLQSRRVNILWMTQKHFYRLSSQTRTVFFSARTTLTLSRSVLKEQNKHLTWRHQHTIGRVQGWVKKAPLWKDSSECRRSASEILTALDLGATVQPASSIYQGFWRKKAQLTEQVSTIQYCHLQTLMRVSIGMCLNFSEDQAALPQHI